MNNKIYYKRDTNKPTSPPLINKKIKFDFKKIKKNTVTSLNEVECFLNGVNKFFNSIKLFKILK